MQCSRLQSRCWWSRGSAQDLRRADGGDAWVWRFRCLLRPAVRRLVNQYKFFRRYGLNDNLTIVINAVLLFVVLFYVYPLKFLFTLLIDKFTGGHGEVRLPNGTVEGMVENAHQVANLMIIFGLGYIAVFAVFALLYWRAYRKRAELELTDLEAFDTRTDIRESLLNVCIGLVSLAVAILGGGRLAGISGMIYMLTPVVMTVHGTWNGRRRKTWKAPQWLRHS